VSQLGALLTIWMPSGHDWVGSHTAVQTAAFGGMFAAAWRNVYAAPPQPGSVWAMVQSGEAQLALCALSSMLNGLVKTSIYMRASVLGDEDGGSSSRRRSSRPVVSASMAARWFSGACQLAALAAASTMFLLGPVANILPQ
jgi:hypothetical protein